MRDPVEPSALDAVFDWFRAVDDRFSTWRSDTEISRFGRGEMALADASDDLREVLARCDELRARTWGAFDIGVGSDPRVEVWEGLGRIDPSGFVKGWALDRAAGLLRAAGARCFALNAGGDVLVAGAPGAGGWVVGIDHPTQPGALACAVSVTDAGVATSGRYRRGDHILDPRTGRPATSVLAATVIASTLGEADALATGLVALGADAERWLLGHPDVAAFVVTADGTALSTDAFAAHRCDSSATDV